MTMAYRTVAIAMSLSDLRSHSAIVSLFKRDFCSPVVKQLTRLKPTQRARAVPLR